MGDSTNKTFRIGSITSGIASECVAVANAGLAWEHIFFAEIAPFPRALLKHRYPGVPNLGDITRAGIEEDIRLANVDLLVASTPCQSFSSAGLREGLSDPRGQLSLRFAEICAHARPPYVLWENVPGAFNADKGEAFRQILSALDDIGYHLAWRVLDAQYAGLAQRRKRVFLVGCLGDETHPSQILFDAESVLGDPPPRRSPGSEVAGTLEARARAGGQGPGPDAHGAASGYLRVVNALKASDGGADVMAAQAGHLVAAPLTTRAYADTAAAETRLVASTLGRREHGDTQTTVVAGPLKATSGKSGPGLDGAQAGHLVSGTLPSAARAHNTVQGAQQGLLVSHALNAKSTQRLDPSVETFIEVIPFDEQQITHPENRSACLPGSPSPSLVKGVNHARPPSIAFNVYPTTGQGRNVRAQETEISAALSRTGGGEQTDRGTRVVGPQSGVRRLTPVECERLQGYPDGYTLLPKKAYKSKKFKKHEIAEMAEYLGISLEEATAVGATPDSVRYAALGNSIATKVLEKIFLRLEAVRCA